MVEHLVSPSFHYASVPQLMMSILPCNRDCAGLLVSLHSAAAEGKLKAVHRKFSSSDRGAVALLTPAKSLSSKSS
jgi:hypothetical protein